jgi:hypothetical protein
MDEIVGRGVDLAVNGPDLLEKPCSLLPKYAIKR